MLNRRVLLIFSVLFSIALHAALIAVSDRVSLLAVASRPPNRPEVFRVDLVQEEEPPAPPALPEGPLGESAPAAVEEFLTRETRQLAPEELSLLASVEVPQLAERLSNENLEREHQPERDEDTLARIDAKLIEIAANEARRDIEVPRRLVRPSATRIVGPDEFPVFRDDAAAEMLPLRAAPMSTFGSEPIGVVAGVPAPAEAMSRLEMGPSSAPEPPLDRLELPVEERVARAPVMDELRDQNSYEFLDDLVDIEVSSYIPPNEKQGYFRLRMTPRRGAQIPVLPKDVTFVVDASSSIAQRKLDSTLKGLQEAIRLLRPEDRFNVVIFRDTPKPFRSDRVPATDDNKAAAIAFLNGQKSFGETDVFNAIRPVVEAPVRDGYPGLMLVVSDGRPTTGVRDGRTIINLLTDENRYRNPIYAYGGGRTVNRYLLDLLAYRNKGESFVSADIGTMDRDLAAFFADLNDPLLINLQADFANVDESSIYPRELPDFFRSRAVTIYGRFDPTKDDDFVMRLAGVAGSRKKELVYRADLKSAKTGDAQIARNWAFRKIYALIEEMCSEGETPERLAQLRQLSSQYNIRTSYDE